MAPLSGVVAAFPPAMPAEVTLRMRRLARGEKPDAYGMQALEKRMALAVQERLARVLEGRTEYYPAQLIMPAAALPARMEKAAFLGVATSPVPELVRDQLNLPQGVGLVVDFVEKGSPAEGAGIKVHDVLEKLDDQLLVNGQQLAVLVRGKKPGDTVTLTVIHGGKEQALKIKLTEKEVAVLGDVGEPMTLRSGGMAINPPEGWSGGLPSAVPPNMLGSSFRLNGDGSSVRRQVDEQNDISVMKRADGKETLSVKDREGHVLYDGPGDALDKANLPAEVVKKIEDLRQKPNSIQWHAGGAPGTSGAEGGAATRTFTANRKDDKYDITLKSNAGGRHLTVKEIGSGKVVFDGPANTDDEMKALPAEVREKVQAMLEKIK